MSQKSVLAFAKRFQFTLTNQPLDGAVQFRYIYVGAFTLALYSFISSPAYL
jgi:hypothetical protein